MKKRKLAAGMTAAVGVALLAGILVCVFGVYISVVGVSRSVSGLSGGRVADRTEPGPAPAPAFPGRQLPPAPAPEAVTPDALAELDREFEAFTGIRPEPAPPVPVAKAAEAEPETEMARKTRAFIEEVRAATGLERVKVTTPGEIWIHLDSGADPRKARKTMAEAADRYRDMLDHQASVKVVLWDRGRPATVQTYFGDPIF